MWQVFGETAISAWVGNIIRCSPFAPEQLAWVLFSCLMHVLEANLADGHSIWFSLWGKQLARCRPSACFAATFGPGKPARPGCAGSSPVRRTGTAHIRPGLGIAPKTEGSRGQVRNCNLPFAEYVGAKANGNPGILPPRFPLYGSLLRLAVAWPDQPFFGKRNICDGSPGQLPVENNHVSCRGLTGSVWRFVIPHEENNALVAQLQFGVDDILGFGHVMFREIFRTGMRCFIDCARVLQGRSFVRTPCPACRIQLSNSTASTQSSLPEFMSFKLLGRPSWWQTASFDFSCRVHTGSYTQAVRCGSGSKKCTQNGLPW